MSNKEDTSKTKPEIKNQRLTVSNSLEKSKESEVANDLNYFPEYDKPTLAGVKEHCLAAGCENNDNSEQDFKCEPNTTKLITMIDLQLGQNKTCSKGKETHIEPICAANDNIQSKTDLIKPSKYENYVYSKTMKLAKTNVKLLHVANDDKYKGYLQAATVMLVTLGAGEVLAFDLAAGGRALTAPLATFINDFWHIATFALGAGGAVANNQGDLRSKAIGFGNGVLVAGVVMLGAKAGLGI